MDQPPVTGRLRAVVLVGAGGFAGAVLRHAVGLLVPGSVLATLATNVAGAFVLGLLVSDGRAAGVLTRQLRLLAATGFLSSFTTYSTFAHQTATAPTLEAVAIVMGTYGLGLVAVALGMGIARWSA